MTIRLPALRDRGEDILILARAFAERKAQSLGTPTPTFAPAFAAWALEQTWRSSDSILGTRLKDHRLAYLDYEGPLSDGRGMVARVDHGVVEWLHQSADELEARLVGDAWQGTIRLTRIDEERDEWRITICS